MMKIVFKNGKEVEISQEIAEIINHQIMNGAKQWQTFSNKGEEVILMVNLNEVAYIN